MNIFYGADSWVEIETRKAKKKMVLNQSRTRTAKVKAQAEYNTANKRVKESIKKDKNDYVDSLASQTEEAAGQGNIKELYMLSKKLAGKYQQTDKPVKDKNKNVLTTTGEQIKRWAEHFQSVLPMRFCEKVGFFLGTDNATTEGGISLEGSGGVLPRKFFKIPMQIELFYSVLGNNYLYFHC